MRCEMIVALNLILLVSTVTHCRSAVPHSHSSGGQAERVRDGGKSPKESHYKDGEHHTEYDHEAVLGSRKEAQEYDELSPEEAKLRLGKLVKKMDGNKDGFVDNKELYNWIKRSLKTLSLEEAQERLEEEDEDRDGVVTWEEHVSASFGNVDSLDADDEKYMKEDRLLWDASDANGDGVLDGNSEFLRFAVVEDDPELLQLALNFNMQEKDKNEDGMLDFEEYLGEQAADRDKEYILSEKENFEEYDKDKDGLLDKKEASEWLYPSNDEMAKEEVDHLIAEADDNGDNKLSYEEIIENHELFVGSEATRYGDALHFRDEL